jgi:hypothetical protein
MWIELAFGDAIFARRRVLTPYTATVTIIAGGMGVMAKHMKPIKVTPKSELEPLLDEADSNSPVLLERRGVVYRLSKADADLAFDDEVDAEAVRRMLDETLGSWADVDVDRMIEDIYSWRRAGSRPPDRP